MAVGPAVNYPILVVLLVVKEAMILLFNGRSKSKRKNNANVFFVSEEALGYLRRSRVL